MGKGFNERAHIFSSMLRTATDDGDAGEPTCQKYLLYTNMSRGVSVKHESIQSGSSHFVLKFHLSEIRASQLIDISTSMAKAGRSIVPHLPMEAISSRILEVIKPSHADTS